MLRMRPGAAWRDKRLLQPSVQRRPGLRFRRELLRREHALCMFTRRGRLPGQGQRHFLQSGALLFQRSLHRQPVRVGKRAFFESRILPDRGLASGPGKHRRIQEHRDKHIHRALGGADGIAAFRLEGKKHACHSKPKFGWTDFAE